MNWVFRVRSRGGGTVVNDVENRGTEMSYSSLYMVLIFG